MRKSEQILLMLKRRASTKKARNSWRIVILIYPLLLRLNTRLFDNFVRMPLDGYLSTLDPEWVLMST